MTARYDDASAGEIHTLHDLETVLRRRWWSWTALSFGALFLLSVGALAVAASLVFRSQVSYGGAAVLATLAGQLAGTFVVVSRLRTTPCLPVLRASSQLTELGDFEYPGMLWAFRWFMVLGGAAAGFAVWMVLEAGWVVEAPPEFNPQVIFATAFLAGIVVASARMFAHPFAGLTRDDR